MASTEDPKGAETPPSEISPENGASTPSGEHTPPSASAPAEDAYNYIDDGYPTEDHSPPSTTVTGETPPAACRAAGKGIGWRPYSACAASSRGRGRRGR